MPFSHECFRYLIGRAMPEGLQFQSQEQWLMGYVDSLERTILRQSAERRLSDKQVQAAESTCYSLIASGQDQKIDAAQQILDAIKSV